MTAAPLRPERREWTVDDLGELPNDLRYELVNGRLIVPSPTHLHQDLCVEILLALRANCPPEYVVSLDLSMKVNRRNEPRPDVVALRPDRVDRSPVPVEDAILAVEVVSPESTFRDMYDKARVYAHAGVATYWVVDPLHERMTLTEMLLGANGEYEVGVHTDDVFTTERPWKVTIDLPALTTRWAGLRERRGA
ncbi:Endonuclease, Uma2 family (restriction endonuclease fold) [Micromonospora pattaloongensis]|uniref:Endonuclease, Uma2 family (Restriction endonuclease fold) n=1 Tax=Micromonospora pattaloongensis TaxID=405436 RepID=A0A1H3KSS4_9ACTN|nr:Uma2 family endonuclease [Micromonospora pattaloongensis]SDY54724.1 Endonuclease, Uma2 family (restriction endonuclease fold) [Micromonospora pattaloongensis]